MERIPAIDQAIELIKETYGLETFLNHIHNEELVKHLSSTYFIADDEEDALVILIDAGTVDDILEDSFDNLGTDLPNFREKDCKSILKGIISKEGWNFVYKILEQYEDYK